MIVLIAAKRVTEVSSLYRSTTLEVFRERSGHMKLPSAHWCFERKARRFDNEAV